MLIFGFQLSGLQLASFVQLRAKNLNSFHRLSKALRKVKLIVFKSLHCGAKWTADSLITSELFKTSTPSILIYHRRTAVPLCRYHYVSMRLAVRLWAQGNQHDRLQLDNDQLSDLISQARAHCPNTRHQKRKRSWNEDQQEKGTTSFTQPPAEVRVCRLHKPSRCHMVNKWKPWEATGS